MGDIDAEAKDTFKAPGTLGVALGTNKSEAGRPPLPDRRGAGYRLPRKGPVSTGFLPVKEAMNRYNRQAVLSPSVPTRTYGTSGKSS